MPPALVALDVPDASELLLSLRTQSEVGRRVAIARQPRDLCMRPTDERAVTLALAHTSLRSKAVQTRRASEPLRMADLPAPCGRSLSSARAGSLLCARDGPGAEWPCRRIVRHVG
jgi:hypothetical protein